VSAGLFGLYLMVQSYSYLSADGGGYFMQRLNAARSPRDAQKGALVFLVIHYLTRVWPWFVVGLAALVLIPLGQESESLGGAAAWAAEDREMAWPVLMAHLLTPGWLGLVLVSLLAAFMSTVDTHINWGASYIVTDVWLVLRPAASDREQIRVARTTVLLFVVVAIGVSFQISTIEQAWKWIAMLGASLGLPTLLRWLWWRVNAMGEIVAMLSGMLAGTLLALLTDLPYEIRLLWIAAASAIGLVVGICAGPRTDPECLHRFVAQVRPLGRWPQAQTVTYKRIVATLLRWVGVVTGTLLLLLAGHQVLFTGQWWWALGAGIAALGCLWGGIVGAMDTA
jgi:Na+/proline symporter